MTLISGASTYRLGFNERYYTFAFILLIKIVLCSKFPWNKYINHKCFDMKSGLTMLPLGGDGARVVRRNAPQLRLSPDPVHSTGCSGASFFFFFTLVTGPRRSLSLELSDTRVCEPQIRARGSG